MNLPQKLSYFKLALIASLFFTATSMIGFYPFEFKPFEWTYIPKGLVFGFIMALILKKTDGNKGGENTNHNERNI